MNATIRWRAWQVVGDESGFVPLVPQPDEEKAMLAAMPGFAFGSAEEFAGWLRWNIAGLSATAVIRIRQQVGTTVTWSTHYPIPAQVAA